MTRRSTLLPPSGTILAVASPDLEDYHTFNKLGISSCLTKKRYSWKSIAKSQGYRKTSEIVRTSRLKTSEHLRNNWLTLAHKDSTRAAMHDAEECLHKTCVVSSLKWTGNLEYIYENLERIVREHSKIMRCIENIPDIGKVFFTLEMHMEARPTYENGGIHVRSIDKSMDIPAGTYALSTALINEYTSSLRQYVVHMHILCRDQDYEKIRVESEYIRFAFKEKYYMKTAASNDELHSSKAYFFHFVNYLTKLNVSMPSKRCSFARQKFDAPMPNEHHSKMISEISLRLARESTHCVLAKSKLSKHYLQSSRICYANVKILLDMSKKEEIKKKQEEIKLAKDKYRQLAKKYKRLREIIYKNRFKDDKGWSSDDYVDKVENSPKLLKNWEFSSKNPDNHFTEDG